MNKEKVRALFREAGLDAYAPVFMARGADVHQKFFSRLEVFAALMEEAVREECAQVCDRQMDIEEIHPAMAVAAGNCADAIRFGEEEG
jgi:hypothetical protein